MKPLYLGSSRGLVVLSLTIALVCLIAALYTRMNAFVIASIVFAIVPVLVSAFATESNRPSENFLKEFLERELHGKVGGDVFTVEAVKTGSFAALYADRMYVSFRAHVVLKQTLFKTTDIPWSKFGGITNRQLEAVRKRASTVVELLGAEAADLIEKMPADLFTLFYVAPTQLPGERFSFTGGLTAIPCGNGWRFSLRHINHERQRVEDLGRSIISFGNAVVVGTRQGDARIAELVAAWKDFFKTLSALEERIQGERKSRGERAVETFLAEVKAGTVFHGMGHSHSGQHAPTPFFLEIRSVDAGEKTLSFLLRNDGPWENARRFQATVSYNATEDVVWIHATTQRRDAFENGGPLIGAPAGFGMDLNFTAGRPSHLATTGGDVSMQLSEISRDALSGLRDQLFARKRQAQQVIAPGTCFAGNYNAGGSVISLNVLFIEPSVPGTPVEAKVETPGWSGMFQVTLASNPYDSRNHDLILSPIVAANGTTEEASSPADVRQIRLSISQDGLAGVIDGAKGTFEVSLRRTRAPAMAVGGAGNAGRPAGARV